ncbi:MAG: class I SAM-dependent methyltransferase [Oscillospiraceae bacterium]|nr:class I SAM-dependent methyltransferase [Oscillospiraceae bacterium]
MDSVNKTLYIPLYGKSYVSRKGIIMHDPKAEQIWAAEGFPLKGKSKSKWLAYYLGMRAAVFDRWLEAQMDADPSAVVLHIGCGLDSRVERVGTQGHLWFDIDFPDVIRERKRYYQEIAGYEMRGVDVRSAEWLGSVPGGNAIVVMEGVSMYLRSEELKQVLGQIAAHFDKVRMLMDCYTAFAAKASRVRNPINDVGVSQVYGLDDPKLLEGDGIAFVGEHGMAPADLVGELRGMEKKVFKALYAGSIAKRMYRLYEYRRDRWT